MNQEERVLITGAYGFLGAYIRRAFEQAGQQVLSLGRSSKNDIPLDLSKEEPDMDEFKISRVIHCAGLAHILPKTKADAQEFYNINLEGTENLLLSLVPKAQSGELKQFVFISSTAVYGKYMGFGVPEDVSLDATSPYAQSKIHAEEQVQTWSQQYGVPALILRLPVVAGVNAPQAIKDIIKNMEKGRQLRIGQGTTRKSMVLAEDVASHLVHWVDASGIYNLTDGHHPSFAEIEDYLAERLNLKAPKGIPDWRARILSGIGDLIPGFPIHSRLYQLHTAEMTFDDSKARRELDWKPRRVLDVEWL